MPARQIAFRSTTGPTRPYPHPLRAMLFCSKRHLCAKVFVEASLRDPASADKLLAEGEGLFYMRRPPTSPPPPSAEHTRRSSPHPAVGAVATAAAAAPPPPITTTSSALADARGSKGETTGQPGGTTGQPRDSSPPSRTSSEKVSSTNAATAKSGLLSYDEAIREFGAGNPDAAANVVTFYGGDLSMLNQTAKL